MKVKLLSLFSGIGAPEKALTNLGIAYDLVGYSEIDKYASKAYSLIHNIPESKNLGDITKIDPDALPEDIDMVTYGFPCQDISVAGKQRGFTDENGERTRSGLFFEALRIIQRTQPKVAIAENVKALTGKKFSAEFKIVLDSLNEAGYNNYWRVLNAKDFGVPQNRERLFIISVRKDIDQGYFVYPNKLPLTIKLRDVLEQNVDEKYYLRDEQIQSIKASGFNQKRTIIQNDICGTAQKLEPNMTGVTNTLTTVQKDNLVIEPNVGHNPVSKKLEFDGFRTDVSPCLIATDYKAPKCTMTQDMRIRKLTPKECWRLMGFADTDIDKCIAANVSDAQLYKQAGNSIVVNVLENLFKNILTILDR